MQHLLRKTCCVCDGMRNILQCQRFLTARLRNWREGKVLFRSRCALARGLCSGFLRQWAREASSHFQAGAIEADGSGSARGGDETRREAKTGRNGCLTRSSSRKCKPSRAFANDVSTRRPSAGAAASTRAHHVSRLLLQSSPYS